LPGDWRTGYHRRLLVQRRQAVEDFVPSRVETLQRMLEASYQMLANNVRGLDLEAALFVPPGGYRSAVGTLKHIAGWSRVYRSYAFDEEPRHWRWIDWPRGLRDTIVKSQDYLDEVIAWTDEAHRLWMRDLERLSDDDVDSIRRLHWGASATLFEVVGMISRHHVYHTGELNQLLSIYKGEAWEETEEVEENNVSTVGHRVRPPWMDQRG
jgi:hypothetical protein